MRTLAEWAPAFSEPDGTAIKMAPELAERRLGVFGKQPEPKSLRAAAAHLLEYDWSEGDPAHSGQLTLTQSKERKGLAARKRAAAERAGVTALRERIDALRAVLDGTSTVTQWARKYPEDARKWGLPTASDAGRRIVIGEGAPIREGTKDQLLLFRLLNARDVEALLQTGVWLSPRVGEAGTPLGDYVRTAFPHKNLPTLRSGDQVFTAKDPYDSASADYRVLLSLYGEDGRLGVRENVVDVVPHRLPPTPPGVPTAAINSRSLANSTTFLLKCPEPRTGHLNPETDPRLQKLIPIKELGLAARPLTSLDGFQQLARVTGLTLVTDDFAETRLRRFRYEGTEDTIRISDLLDQMTRAYHYTWRLEGDLLLLRHADWCFAEEREIPAKIASDLAKRAAIHDSLSLADQARLAMTLTRSQFEMLPAYVPGTELLRTRHHALFLIGSMTDEQRQAAQSEDGLPFVRLLPAQQTAFLEVTRNEAPLFLVQPLTARAEWRLRLTESSSNVKGYHLLYGFGPNEQTGCFVFAAHQLTTDDGAEPPDISPGRRRVL